jgi:hypothetical protein
VPRLGLEAIKPYHQLRFIGRAGYYFEWSGSYDPALLDPSRHVLTGGVGLEWTNRLTALQLDGFAQWHHAQASSRVSGDIGVVGVTLGVNL